MSQSDLIFERLELEDFRQYHGKHEIDFSTDPDKHLTLVHAENSVGKTTMLNAMKFCFYGETPEFDEKKELVSDRSTKHTCRVKLIYKYRGQKYAALRIYDQNSAKSALTLHEIDSSGASNKVSGSADAIINNVVPKELSNYFLFAGERYARALGARDKNMSHRRAIRDILGFSLAESVIEDTESLNKTNTKKLNKLLERHVSTESLALEKSILEKDIETCKANIKLHKKDITSNQTIIETNKQLIEKSDHRKAQELLRNKERITKELERNKKERTSYLKKRQGLISTFGYILFGTKLTQKKFDFIEEHQREIPSPYAENMVDRIIREGVCICGNDIEKDSPEEKKLKELRTTATTDYLAKRVSAAVQLGSEFKLRAKEFLGVLTEIEEKLTQFNNYIGTNEKELIQIKNDQESIENADITEYNLAIGNAESRIDALNQKIGKENADKSDYDTRLTVLKTRISQQNVSDKDIQDCQNYEALCERIVDSLKNIIKKTEEESLNKIKDQVQKNIDASLRKEKEVMVDDDYRFQLKDRITGRIDKGDDGGNGQTLLSNLSFISALMTICSNRIENVDEESVFIPGTTAPFVIDAPFADMDGTYRLNTFEFLPQQSHQLIMFISTGQWQQDFEDLIGKYIGERYMLVNHDSTKKFRKNLLRIKGKEYSLNVPSNDPTESPTTIEKI